MKTLGNVCAALGLLALGYWAAQLVTARLWESPATETHSFARCGSFAEMT
jgi:hypothetical protein